MMTLTIITKAITAKASGVRLIELYISIGFLIVYRIIHFISLPSPSIEYSEEAY